MDWKTFWNKLIFPPLWLVILLTAASAAALPVVLIRGLAESPVAYLIYIMAFYTLCVVCVFCVKVLPGRFRRLRERIDANPVGHLYMTDAAFQTRVSLYVSLAVNLLYVGVNVLSWFLYRSMWFWVLAGYYVILAVMRFLLVRYTRLHALGRDRLAELRRASTCAWILLLVNFALTGAVMMILYQNKGFAYHGVLIYAAALYTFYLTIHAAVELVRYRKYRSPVMTAAKIVSLSAALVSMLSLETAMLSQFGGDMTPEAKWLMIALTGAGVSAAVIVLSVFMIVKAGKEIKEIGNDEE